MKTFNLASAPLWTLHVVRNSLLVAFFSFFLGCVTTGRDFPSDLGWIKQDQTKKQDITMVLGEPYARGLSSGKETWTYGFYRYRLIGKSYTKELKLYWNADGTVSHYSYNSSFPEDTNAALKPVGKGVSGHQQPMGPGPGDVKKLEPKSGSR